MCILCVASKWSRRVVTMLPWLIIPLIILWALSQLLPPGFRFEVTSPRLACVAVLLVSLGWYELVMPMLSSWRARRSVLLWERRRIELQEAAKWRKEALRCCRNCLTPYRDQTPSGGRFMCTYCGHVSKRPVLDITGRAPGSMGPGMARIRVTGGGNLPGAISASGLVTGGMFCGKWNSRIWSGRGLPNKAGKAGGRGWRAGRSSMIEAGGWGVNGPWFGSSGAGGKGCSVVGVGGWGGMGDSFPCGMFGGGRCTEAESNSVVLLFLFRLFSYAAFWLGWIWRKLPRLVRTGEDNLNGGRRPGQSKVEDGSTLHGSRVDKARRKAEEKRQAKLEKELLEAEERKQREEVARLVEERRRQRDEKLEAEIENEKDAATKREREVRKEREAERRQHDKAREREKGFSKDEPKEQEAKQNKGKDNEKRNDTELNERKKAKKSMLNEVERHKCEKLFGGPRQEETGSKSIESQLKSVTGNMSKSGSSRYLGSSKSSLFLHSKNTGYFSNSSRSFLGRRLSTSSNFGVKFGNVATRTTPTASSSSVLHAGSTGRVTEASGSSSNKTPWTKVWGNGSVSEDNGRSDLNVQCEMKHLLNGSPVRSFSPPTVGVPQPPIAPRSSQTKSFDHIFSSPLVFPPIELPMNMRNEQDHEQGEVGSKKPCSPLTPCHILFGTSDFPPPQSSETSYEQTPLLLSELRSRASISHRSLLVPSGLDNMEEIGGVEMNDPLSLLGSVFDAMLRLIEDLMRAGHAFTDKLFNILIRSYGRAGMPRQAEECFHFMRSVACASTPHTYNTLLNIFANTNQLDKAISVFQDTIWSKFTPDVVTYTMLITAFFAASKIGEARSVMNEMARKRCTCDIFIHNMTIEALCKQGKVDNAVKHFSEMEKTGCNLDETIYATLLNGLWDAGRVDEVASTFTSMIERGCPTNVVIHCIMIKGFCRISRAEDLEAVLMLNWGHCRVADLLLPSKMHCLMLRMMNVLKEMPIL